MNQEANPLQQKGPVTLDACPITADEKKPDTLLRCEGLTKAFRHKTVVNTVSVEVRGGEIVGLLGPNGAGKTTIFYMIVGFIKPTSGDIFMDHHNISSLPMYKRAHLGISYLSQEASIFRKLTVSENIDAVLEILNIPENEKKSRKEEVISELG